MDKRTLLAVGLSVLVLIGFQFLYAPKTAPVAPGTEQTAEQDAQVAADDSAAGAAPVPVRAEPAPAPSTVAVAEAPVANDVLELTFNSNTGDIHNAHITQYKHREITGAVFKDGAQDYFRFLTPQTGVFTGDVHAEGEDIVAVFSSKGQGALRVTKTYRLQPESYVIDVSVQLTNTGDTSLSIPVSAEIGPGLGEGFEEGRYNFEGPEMFDGEKLEKEKPAKVEETITMKNPLWAGYTSKYFLFAMMNGEFSEGAIRPFEGSAIVSGSRSVILNPGDRKEVSFELFVGPKEYDLLKETGYGMQRSIEYGFFSFIAIPMLRVMNFIYDYIGNYGVAIILLTILIKLVTFPLTQKSMVSMRKMSKLQPKMKELREKYKSEPSKMNAAVMELYKKEGVNPMGGCLPILIQIPVFFALYKTLLVSIELKGSPFFFWIVDLSAKDPLYITPILMGISMFFQQKMSPSTADPAQQKIFMLMPVIFTFLFLTFPAGLVIYWLTNNVLSIAQQYVINKKTA